MERSKKPSHATVPLKAMFTDNLDAELWPDTAAAESSLFTHSYQFIVSYNKLSLFLSSNFFLLFFKNYILTT